VTNEKDTVIADLGVQVAYVNTREQEVDATHKKLADNLALVEEEATQAKEDIEDLKKKLESSKASYDKFMAGEATRSAHASSLLARPRRPTGRTTTITNLGTTGLG
jgi:chromosome segregation ATPase